MRFVNKERRKDPRSSYINKTEFVFTPNTVDTTVKESFEKFLTMDKSKNGLSFYAMIPLKKGKRIRIIGNTPPHTWKPARIKWVQKLESGLYKAGAMFAEE